MWRKIAAAVLLGCVIFWSNVYLAIADESYQLTNKQTQIITKPLERIAGVDRYDTSVKIAKRFNDGKVDNVIVVSGRHFADALSASALAQKLNAPILLADSSYTAKAEEYIENHLSENGTVYLIGDTPDAYSGAVNIERIRGADHYQTNIAVLNALNIEVGTPLVIASGESFPDALSVAGFGLPIILTDGKNLSADAQAIIKRVKPEKVYIVGGYSVVSLGAEKQVGLPVKRLAGSNRFATAAAILREFLPHPSTLYITTGYNYADALAGSVLGPIMITDPNLLELPVPLNDYLVDVGTVVEIIPLGGPSIVRDKTLEGIKKLYPKQEYKKTDFVNLAEYAPNILLDIRYATTNNFTGKKLYDSPIAYLRKGTADKLKAVADELAQQGYHLRVWDAYRPVAVQWKLWNAFPNANYIANPNTGYSNHNRGSAVDVTIDELEMPTDYDDFTWKARREYQNENAKFLEQIMVKHGFKPYAGEWWHFDDTDYYEPVESLVLPAQRQPQPLPKTSITISAIGDNVIGQDYFGDFDSYYSRYGADYFFANVKHLFQNDDLTIANLETTLTTATVKVDKRFQGNKAFYFKGRPEYTKILTAAGIDTVNIANNHTFDYLQKGFEDTKNNLAKAGIGWFGYSDVDIQEVKGKRIALAGYNLLGPIEEGVDLENMKKQVAAEVAELKKSNDLVIVSFHWGIENEFKPDQTQIIFGRLAIDAGADLVLGHHPHVLQPIEVYKDKYIVYSLGNFVFGGNTRPRYTDTMIFQMTFNFVDDELSSVVAKVIPASVTSDPTKNNYKPVLLSGSDAERVHKQVGK